MKSHGRNGTLPARALVGLALLIGASAAPAEATDRIEAEIRSIRAASNAALAAGDMERFITSLDEDYAGTGGSGGHVQSREQLAERVGGVIADAPGLHYVRTPGNITVGDGDTRAFEVGAWVEVRPDGTEGLRGGYSAHWRRLEDRWVIHAELFVTLHRGAGD